MDWYWIFGESAPGGNPPRDDESAGQLAAFGRN
jgi:hypothetical protein